MQTIIRTGTAQEQIDAASHNLDRVGGIVYRRADVNDNLRGRLEFYFQARIELANAMNHQRIADSLEQLVKLWKNQPVIVTNRNEPCSCGAGDQASPPDHVKNCPSWAPF